MWPFLLGNSSLTYLWHPYSEPTNSASLVDLICGSRRLYDSNGVNNGKAKSWLLQNSAEMYAQLGNIQYKWILHLIEKWHGTECLIEKWPRILVNSYIWATNNHLAALMAELMWEWKSSYELYNSTQWASQLIPCDTQYLLTYSHWNCIAWTGHLLVLTFLINLYSQIILQTAWC